jgi:hypothetical protein
MTGEYGYMKVGQLSVELIPGPGTMLIRHRLSGAACLSMRSAE